MIFESQYTISDWADATFGPASSNARVAARANEEMAELLRALTADDQHEKAAEEVADVIIVLCRLMTRLGRDLEEEVDRKMQINRSRQWNLTKDGHGYHVRDKAQGPVSSPDRANRFCKNAACHWPDCVVEGGVCGSIPESSTDREESK